MARKDVSSLYDKNHVIPIYDKNGQIEERRLNIMLLDVKDTLQIKIRDPTEYSFNYSENIDTSVFEIMRANQSLDIDFSEFKYNLIEMLQQYQKKDMFLKCEIVGDKCTLVFYGKSKIKSLIFLTIDLHMTNQTEILSELISNMHQIEVCNERLKKQLSNMQKSVSEKDQQIQHLNNLRSQLEKRFFYNLKELEDMFKIKFDQVENILTNKLVLTKQRVTKLIKDVETVKKEATLNLDSNTRLVRTIENLKLEATENCALINQLKKENSTLHTSKLNQEKCLVDLRRSISEKDGIITELQKKNEELRADLEKATIIITQKKSTLDELSQDLIQANQMLVNFNNHYDLKVRELEELQNSLVNKDKIISEQRLKSNNLLKEFEEYKATFNKEEQERLKHELLLANDKIQNLEKSIRKANKINTLLTEKVNNQHFGLNH